MIFLRLVFHYFTVSSFIQVNPLYRQFIGILFIAYYVPLNYEVRFLCLDRDAAQKIEMEETRNPSKYKLCAQTRMGSHLSTVHDHTEHSAPGLDGIRRGDIPMNHPVRVLPHKHDDAS